MGTSSGASFGSKGGLGQIQSIMNGTFSTFQQVDLFYDEYCIRGVPTFLPSNSSPYVISHAYTIIQIVWSSFLIALLFMVMTTFRGQQLKWILVDLFLPKFITVFQLFVPLGIAVCFKEIKKSILEHELQQRTRAHWLSTITKKTQTECTLKPLFFAGVPNYAAIWLYDVTVLVMISTFVVLCGLAMFGLLKPALDTLKENILYFGIYIGENEVMAMQVGVTPKKRPKMCTCQPYVFGKHEVGCAYKKKMAEAYQRAKKKAELLKTALVDMQLANIAANIITGGANVDEALQDINKLVTTQDTTVQQQPTQNTAPQQPTQNTAPQQATQQATGDAVTGDTTQPPPGDTDTTQQGTQKKKKSKSGQDTQ
ncbi:transmembrane protein, putative [Bodo saltans]|uniref:Transmembrane protein, putative n=1 Tax=Bodo saltans TaxID=75058 RepID=A0A0S4ISA3_BODSA|nr:transmembrane protein, putative [Bodo saltans]|eukprot:CUG05552.1 transmembrane protein, putative [Bodo saltans]